LISNSEKFVCEGISVSFGYFIDNKLILPSKDMGGYFPPLIKIIAKHAAENKLEVLFKSNITRKDLLEADEVFLIDNCLGIQKVLGLNNRRYYSTKTTILSSLVKDLASQSLLPPVKLA
jgi:branched-subunit amino acid aminotransferase/4-amino-4-deoxychorismate lyase